MQGAFDIVLLALLAGANRDRRDVLRRDFLEDFVATQVTAVGNNLGQRLYIADTGDHSLDTDHLSDRSALDVTHRHAFGILGSWFEA